MRTRRRTAVLWLVALACALAGARARAATPAVDAPAPPFVAQTPDGARFDLAQLRGKVVLLHFWATWCDSCRTEMPALAHVYADLHARGLELLAVSADDPRERRAALEMAQRYHLPATLLEAVRPNGFGAPPVLPLTYVIDRGGVLRARLLPVRAPLTEDSLRAALVPLLDSPPPESGSGQ